MELDQLLKITILREKCGSVLVSRSPSPPVILSSALVILSEAKDLGPPSGVNSAKDLGLWLRINSAKDLGFQRRAQDDSFGLFEKRSERTILKKKGGVILLRGTRGAPAKLAKPLAAAYGLRRNDG
jgi:hypothetical protein